MFFARPKAHHKNPGSTYIINPPKKRHKRSSTMARKRHRRNPESYAKRSRAAKKAWRGRRHHKSNPMHKSYGSRKRYRRNAGTSSSVKHAWATITKKHKGSRRFHRAYLKNPPRYHSGRRHYKRNPGMSGIFEGVKNSAVMALWELLGAFGVNVVANNVASAASITDSTTKDLVKAGVAIVPQFFKKSLGDKADLMTAGALLVLGYNVVSNALSSLGLPANIVSMLQDGNGSSAAFIPAPGIARLYPNQGAPVGRLIPAGSQNQSATDMN